MSETTCATCRWQSESTCHRYPPKPVIVDWRMTVGHEYQTERIVDRWPSVMPDDWCGEHAPKGEEMRTGVYRVDISEIPANAKTLQADFVAGGVWFSDGDTTWFVKSSA